MLYEVTLALTRKGFSRSIIERRIDEVMALFRAGVITLVEPDAELMKDAVQIAWQVSPDPRIKPWLNDAVFHALARREHAMLVTADERYVARLEAFPTLRDGVVLLERARV